MATPHWLGLKRLLRGRAEPSELSPLDDEVFLQRIRFVERGVALPAKAVLLGIVLYLLFVSRWFMNLTMPQEEAWNILRSFFLLYFALNVGASILIWGMDEVPAHILKRVVYSVAILDAAGLAARTGTTSE